MKRTDPAGKWQRGATLIEGLVGIVVLSVCALAYVSLQIDGASKNTSAMWRTKATQLAYEMSDRMRANQGGLATGSYDALIASPSVPPCATSVQCRPADMAQLDYAQWRAGVARALPDGAGVVCLTSTPFTGTAANPACSGSGLRVIKIFWTEKASSAMFATVVRP